jgi:hypothetical protein
MNLSHYSVSDKVLLNKFLKGLTMRKKITFILSIWTIVLLTILPAYATDPNHILNIFITNLTQERFDFSHILNSNPGNEFILSTQSLAPGETLTITAIKHLNNDIAASLLFLNSTGEKIPLLIVDQEQIHFGRPIFSMSGIGFHTNIISMLRNTNVGPRYLTYLEARLEMKEARS